MSESQKNRTPFGSERRRVTRPLEIVHTDIGEPIETKSWNGKQYYITFLDNYILFFSLLRT